MAKYLKNLTKDRILMVLIAGALLFALSFPLEKLGQTEEDSGTEPTEASYVSDSDTYQETLEQDLELLLEKVDGAGQVKVLVTFLDNGEKIVEKDVQSESSSLSEGGSEDGTDRTTEEIWNSQENTVMENGETPWVSRELVPQVAGVAVVAEGGDSAVVKSEISSLLEALFDLPAHKIKVVKGDF